MGYELNWHIQHKVLSLTLVGDYTIEEAREVNQLILDELEQRQTALIIFINATQMKRPHNFGDIRSVQTFMDHRQLKHIYVTSADRLVKLAMMVIFNLARAPLNMFDDLNEAQFMLDRQLANPR
jgi:hypothetical protein